MRHRFLRFTAAALACVSGSLGGQTLSGELTYSDVDPSELMGWLMSGQPEEAVKESTRMIDGLRPTDNPLTIRLIGEVLTYLCQAHRDLGQYDQAEAACLEAVATYEEASKGTVMAEVEIYSRTLPQLAAIYEEVGKFEAALEVRERQLKRIDNRRVGDPEKVKLLTQIGDLHMLLGRFHDAEASYLEAIAANAKVWRADHRGLAMPHGNLARLYQLEERFDRAETTLHEGLVQAEKTHARMTAFRSELTLSLHAFELHLFSQLLGWTYYHQGRISEARSAAGEVLAFYKLEGDAGSWFATDVKVLLALIEEAENPGSPEARRYLESAVTMTDKGYAEADVFQAIAQSEFARHLLRTGNGAAAEHVARKAAESLAWGLGDDNYQTARANVVLARVLQSRGRHAESRDTAQAAYAAQRAFLPAYHSEIGETLALLSELYAELGQRENREAMETLVAEYKAERAKFESAK